jgi:hypothetical protein
MRARTALASALVSLMAALNASAQECVTPNRFQWTRGIPGMIMIYSIDPSFTPNERQAIEHAFERWTQANARSGHYTVFVEDPQSPARVEVKREIPLSCPECMGEMDGTVQNPLRFITSGIIRLNPGEIADNYVWTLQVALHEIGHLQGLDDVTGMTPNQRSVMADGIPKDDPRAALDVTTCDENAVSNYARVPPPGVASGAPGGGSYTCPWGTGCWGNEHLGCSAGWQYDRWSGWCWLPGEYPLLDPGPNVKPVIDIKWPPNGALFAAPFSGTVQSRMIDPDGRVWRVDYHVNGSPTPSFSTTNHPFSWAVGGVPPGTYHLQAVAYDNAQEYTISPTVTVNVCGPPAPPTGFWGYSAGGWAYLYWNAVPGAIGYQVEAGTVPGASNVGAWGVGSGGFAAPAPPGNYYVRVRVNHSTCGLGSPTADMLLVVQ